MGFHTRKKKRRNTLCITKFVSSGYQGLTKVYGGKKKKSSFGYSHPPSFFLDNNHRIRICTRTSVCGEAGKKILLFYKTTDLSVSFRTGERMN
jgi:hypothetical protein